MSEPTPNHLLQGEIIPPSVIERNRDEESFREKAFLAALSGLCANPHSWDTSSDQLILISDTIADAAIASRKEGQ